MHVPSHLNRFLFPCRQLVIYRRRQTDVPGFAIETLIHDVHYDGFPMVRYGGALFADFRYFAGDMVSKENLMGHGSHLVRVYARFVAQVVPNVVGYCISVVGINLKPGILS